MELFTVNRYDTIEKAHDPDREKRILENLQLNIDKKKHKLKKDKTSKVLDIADVVDASAVADDAPTSSTAEPTAVAELVEQDADVAAATATEKTSPETNIAAANKVATDANFQVLGTDKFRNKQRIDMVLPPWLANPTIIANDLTVTEATVAVDDLSYLSANLKAALHADGIDVMFPVQRAVIPWIIDVHDKPEPFRPRDLCVSAPTGSGKTLAYAVPIVQVLQHRLQRRIRALVVLPVGELAVQVLKQFRKLCEGTTLTCALLSKTVPFEIEQKLLVEQYDGEWYSRVDIIVATTGRLVEHLHSTPGFCLKSLRFLVMDEADRIMEQIQNNWLYHLDSHVKEQSDAFLHGRAVPLCVAELSNESNRQPHKLLFSATLSQDPEKLQSLQLFQPKLFTAIVKRFERTETGESSDLATTPNIGELRGEFVGKFTTPAGLTEKICLTQAELKPLTLFSLIAENGWKRWLCFTNSGESAHRLSFVLQQLMGSDARVEELSSGLSPAVRNTVLIKFQLGQINGLVCSDALARGIDVKDVDVVVSYEMPRHVKTYVHRVGRTARAGKQGLAVTLLLEHEIASFKSLIKEAGKEEMEELRVTSTMEEQKAKEYASAVEKLQLAIKREQQIKVLKHVNEKQKALKKNVQHGLLGQLQSQLQTNSADNHHHDDPNVPESWKWQNQQNIKERAERKGITQTKRKHKAGKKAESSNAATTETKKTKPATIGDGDTPVPAKKAKFSKSK